MCATCPQCFFEMFTKFAIDGVSGQYPEALGPTVDTLGNLVASVLRRVAQAGISSSPAGTGKAVGGRASRQSAAVWRDDGRVRVTLLGEPGKAWPSSPWESGWKCSARTIVGYGG